MKFNIRRNSIKNLTRCVMTLLILGLATVASRGVSAETLYLVRPHSGIEVIDSEDPAHHIGLQDKASTTKGIEGEVDFTIEYQDSAGQGFNHVTLGSARKARLEDALRYVLSAINIQSPTGLDIMVEPSVDAGGFLATAGPFFGDSDFTNGGAFIRLTTGSKPFPSNAEITLTVDFSHNWNTTTSPPAFDEADLLSVLIHELTHGLGILSLANFNGTSQLSGTYTVWDSLTVRDSTGQPIYGGSPPALVGGLASLTSDNLAFGGANAIARYNQSGARPPVHSPSPFVPGSSLSHWD